MGRGFEPHRAHMRIQNFARKLQAHFSTENRNSNETYGQTLSNLKKYQTSTGIYLLPTAQKNDAITKTIISNKIFDEHVIDLIESNFKSASYILDVGANFGQMSIVLANRLAPRAVKIIAFEGEPTTARILHQNIELNDLSATVKIIDKPVWESDNEVINFPAPNFERFDTWGSYGIRRTDDQSQDRRLIRATTIDNHCKNLNVSVIKIDVQGADLYALHGGLETIRACKPAIIFEFEQALATELGHSFQDYLDFMAKIGYKIETVLDGDYLCLPKKM